MDRDNSKLWVISDLHLNHKNIIKYCDRPFESIEVMNEEIIKRWNSTISKQDRVFCLGDFCLSGKNKVIELGNKLNGRKTLLLGNHDTCSVKTYYEAGFDYVYKYPFVYEGVLFSHEPISTINLFNVHGHTHFLNIYDGWHFNVSADVLDFKPILFSEIQRLRKERNGVIVGED